MPLTPEHNDFTYNNSPQFSKKMQNQAQKFIALGKIEPFLEHADKLDRTRFAIQIKENNKAYKFLDVECGALELKYRGIIMFKTSNEMAALFVIFNELGGKITNAHGKEWYLGIDSLIAARNKDDYDLLKKLYEKTL